jgi:hypothetical protein
MCESKGATALARSASKGKAMTEAEWLASSDLRALLGVVSQKASDRKLRLFACACCRRYWHWLENRARRIVEVVELHADGLAGAAEYRDVREQAAALWQEEFGTNYLDNAIYSLTRYPDSLAEMVAGVAISIAATVELEARKRGLDSAGAKAAASAEQVAHCDLLRDICHGPRRAVFFKPRWVRWNNAKVGNIARAIYDERAFDRLPVLADALEDAGCDDADILRHCREPGEHVRGCWVVDLLLGKS